VRAIVAGGGHDVLELMSVSTKLGGRREWMLMKEGPRTGTRRDGLGNRLIRIKHELRNGSECSLLSKKSEESRRIPRWIAA
jgi:hypothetical protein